MDEVKDPTEIKTSFITLFFISRRSTLNCSFFKSLRSGLTAIRAKDKIVNYDFMCKICEQIQESRFLLADISEDNLNVGLELGIAIGLQKTTMVMANEESKEIGDLKRTDSIRYNFENVDKLKSDFSNMIGNILKSN